MTTNPPDSNSGEAEIEFPHANIAAMRVIARTLASTLGPHARDKLLVADQAEDTDAAPGTRLSGTVAAASDGATILERLPLEHPIAPILRRMIGPKRPGDTGVEGEAMPDGITTRAVLAGSLLNRATALLDRGVHPQTIVEGYEAARTVAVDALDATRTEFDEFSNPEAMRVATAETAMTGNVAGGNRTDWARMVVDAVETIGTPTAKSFDVRRTDEGSVADTRLVRGAVLDRNSRVSEEMPRRVDDASVLVLDGHDRGGLMDREVTGDVSVHVESPNDVAKVTAANQRHKADVVDRFVETGVDVVVTRLGIDAEYRRLLVDAGIVGIRGVAPLDLTRVARATGARPVLNTNDVTPAALGQAGSVTELSLGARRNRATERRMISFDACPRPETVTILLKGVSGQVGDQAATAVRKGAFAVAAADGDGSSMTGVVPGGGATHLRIADAVGSAARDVDQRRQLAMEAYADSLEDVVGTLAKNGGLDPLTSLPDVRAMQHDGTETAGIVFPDGDVRDCLDAGVLDPAATVHDAYLYATDVAALLLRIDDAIDAVMTEEPGDVDTDDVIYDEPAERQKQALDDRE